MTKRGFLSARAAELIALTGYTDRLIVCDVGFPVPPTVPRIDRVITRNLPTVRAVLRILLDELDVERFRAAEELQAVSPKRYAEYGELLPGVSHDLIPYAVIKRVAREVRAVMRTGSPRSTWCGTES